VALIVQQSSLLASDPLAFFTFGNHLRSRLGQGLAHMIEVQEIGVWLAKLSRNLSTIQGAPSANHALEPSGSGDAFALAQRFEFHYAPKSGNWRNIIEFEFSALTRECLDRRIPNR